MRIMIASSHEALAHAIGEILDLEDHRHEWVQEADQVLAHLAAEPFDICLIDHQIETVRGATLAQNIRASCPHQPRLVLMARSSDIGTRSRAQATKIECLLPKPFDRRSLLAALHSEGAQ